ncbi:MAG: hypothetical protein EOO88_02505 [Pedobacter sp.]|nr:MAG: hypothetical protein EOO88_02505 [Pedobacter sp.]
MEPGIVFIMLFLCATAMVFGIRYLSNKERMAMIERGIDPRQSSKPAPSAPKPFLSLKFGLLMVGLGLGLIAALLTVVNTNIENKDAAALYFGAILVFGGIGLIISYAIEKKWLDQQKG